MVQARLLPNATGPLAQKLAAKRTPIMVIAPLVTAWQQRLYAHRSALSCVPVLPHLRMRSLVRVVLPRAEGMWARGDNALRVGQTLLVSTEQERGSCRGGSRLVTVMRPLCASPGTNPVLTHVFVSFQPKMYV